MDPKIKEKVIKMMNELVSAGLVASLVLVNVDSVSLYGNKPISNVIGNHSNEILKIRNSLKSTKCVKGVSQKTELVLVPKLDEDLDNVSKDILRNHLGTIVRATQSFSKAHIDYRYKPFFWPSDIEFSTKNAVCRKMNKGDLLKCIRSCYSHFDTNKDMNLVIDKFDVSECSYTKRKEPTYREFSEKKGVTTDNKSDKKAHESYENDVKISRNVSSNSTVNEENVQSHKYKCNREIKRSTSQASLLRSLLLGHEPCEHDMSDIPESQSLASTSKAQTTEFTKSSSLNSNTELRIENNDDGTNPTCGHPKPVTNMDEPTEQSINTLNSSPETCESEGIKRGGLNTNTEINNTPGEHSYSEVIGESHLSNGANAVGSNAVNSECDITDPVQQMLDNIVVPGDIQPSKEEHDHLREVAESVKEYKSVVLTSMKPDRYCVPFTLECAEKLMRYHLSQDMVEDFHAYLDAMGMRSPPAFLDLSKIFVKCLSPDWDDRNSWNMDLGPLKMLTARGTIETLYYDLSQRGRKQDDLLGTCAQGIFYPSLGFRGDPMTEQEFLSNYEEQKEDIKFNKAIGNIFDSGEIMVEYMKDTGPNETFDKNKTFQEKLQDQFLQEVSDRSYFLEEVDCVSLKLKASGVKRIILKDVDRVYVKFSDDADMENIRQHMADIYVAFFIRKQYMTRSGEPLVTFDDWKRKLKVAQRARIKNCCRCKQPAYEFHRYICRNVLCRRHYHSSCIPHDIVMALQSGYLPKTRWVCCHPKCLLTYPRDQTGFRSRLDTCSGHSNIHSNYVLADTVMLLPFKESVRKPGNPDHYYAPVGICIRPKKSICQ